MDTQLSNLENDMTNYQHVKELVLGKLVDEGLLDKDIAEEFDERFQILVYKGTWFNKWFDKKKKLNQSDIDKNKYYMKIIDLK